MSIKIITLLKFLLHLKSSKDCLIMYFSAPMTRMELQGSIFRYTFIFLNVTRSCTQQSTDVQSDPMLQCIGPSKTPGLIGDGQSIK